MLLRHELTPDQLAALILRVRNATDLPVTYADVWGFWVRHRAMSSAVSFVTVGDHCIWTTTTVGRPGHSYVDRLYTEMQRTFPGKRVLIGDRDGPVSGDRVVRTHRAV